MRERKQQVKRDVIIDTNNDSNGCPGCTSFSECVSMCVVCLSVWDEKETPESDRLSDSYSLSDI